MKTALLFGLYLALGPIFAMAQTAPAQQQFSPPWAAEFPNEPPAGSIGLVASVTRLDPHMCTLEIAVLNRTDQTVRSGTLMAEIFFGDRSVVSSATVQFADPGRFRLAQVFVPGGCAAIPSRIVIRDVTFCNRGRIHMSGCGAPFMAMAPAASAPRDFIRVEITADLTR